MATKFFGYFVDRQLDDGQRAFVFSPSLDEVKKQLAGAVEANGGTGEVADETPPDAASDAGLAPEMRRAARLGLAHNHLIGVVTEIRRNFPTAYIKRRIVSPAAIKENVVETVDGVDIYGVTEE